MPTSAPPPDSNKAGSESTEAHRQQAQDLPVSCAVITVSDTRTEETDESGALMRQRLTHHGFMVDQYHVIPDEPDQIEALLDEWTDSVEAILLNGGTGIGARDRTYDVLSRKLEKRLPGFGEIFRVLSYEEVGAAAMLSRATAGVYRDTIIFSTPGSPNAVKLALDKLILPELKHLVWEIIRQK